MKDNEEAGNIQGFSISSDLLLLRLFHADTKPKGMITVLSIDSDAFLCVQWCITFDKTVNIDGEKDTSF